MSGFRLWRIAPEQNARRFYAASVQRSLFGEWEIWREWGRIGQAGQLMHTTHASEEDAAGELRRLQDRKRRRGYKGKG